MAETKGAQLKFSDSTDTSNNSSKAIKDQIKRWKKVQERYKHVKNASGRQDRNPHQENTKKPAYNFCPNIDTTNLDQSRTTPQKLNLDVKNLADSSQTKLDVTTSLKYLSSQIKSSEKVALPQLVHTKPPGRNSVRVKRRLSQTQTGGHVVAAGSGEGEEGEGIVTVQFKTKLPPLVPYKAITGTLAYLTVRGTVAELAATIQDWREHIYTEKDWSQYTEEVSQALLIAVNCGKDEGIRELIQAGGDPNCVKSSNVSLLAMAAAVGNVKSVKHLLEAGAQVFRGPRGETAVHVAARDGRLDLLEILLEKDGKDILHEMAFINASPLIPAIKKESIECVKFLLDKGCGVNSTADRSEKTPLHLAAEKGQEEMVQVLVEKGASLFATELSSRNTPFISAVEEGHGDLAIKHLLPDAGIDTPDVNPGRNGNMDYTMLMYACSAGSLKAVKLLLEHGADLTVKSQGNPPIYPAIVNKRKSVVKHLLPFMDINELSCDDASPLKVALVHHADDLKFLALFLDAGADINQPVNGATPLIYTAWANKRRAFRWLLRRGADPNRVHEKHGVTVLWHVANSGRRSNLQALLRHNPNMFLSGVINSLHKTTALEEALEHQETGLISLLVSAGCSLNHLGEAQEKLWNNTTKALLERSQNPRSLQEVAKLTIKNTLGHSGVEQKIDSLPLPKSLREYLSSSFVDYQFLKMEEDEDEDEDEDEESEDDDDDDDSDDEDDDSDSGSQSSDTDSDG